MNIQVKYYPSEYDITVQTGWNNDGYFEMETCNHAGDLVKEQAYTFDGYNDGEFYICNKCKETFDVWEIDSDPYDSDWAYQSWKDSRL